MSWTFFHLHFGYVSSWTCFNREKHIFACAISFSIENKFKWNFTADKYMLGTNINLPWTTTFYSKYIFGFTRITIWRFWRQDILLRFSTRIDICRRTTVKKIRSEVLDAPNTLCYEHIVPTCHTLHFITFPEY